jgi:hypothetical protein
MDVDKLLVKAHELLFEQNKSAALDIAIALMKSQDQTARESGIYLLSQIPQKDTLDLLKRAIPHIHTPHFRSICEGSILSQHFGLPQLADFKLAPTTLTGDWFNSNHLKLIDFRTEIIPITTHELDGVARKGYPALVREMGLDWPALGRWRRHSFLKLYGQCTANWLTSDESVLINDYVSGFYADGVDRTKYYFGKSGFTKATFNINLDYSVPEYFTTQGWEPLGLSGQYFYLGPANSGAFLHAHGAACNVLIYGIKLWFLFPPTHNWIRKFETTNNYHGKDMLQWNAHAKPKLPQKPIEVLQQSGEVMFIPKGWLHGVLNLTPSIGLAWEMKTNPLSDHSLDYILAQG